MMSRPQKNPKKFSKNDSFFDIALMELFGPYKRINFLEVLLGDFEEFDFGPETEFATPTEMFNFEVF